MEPITIPKLIKVMFWSIVIVKAHTSNDLKQQIISSLDNTSETIDDLDRSNDYKIFNTVPKMSNLLGIIDAFLSFLQQFDPKTDKADMKHMMANIMKANERLAKIHGNVKRERFLKTAFFEVRNIEFSFMLLNKFFDKIERLSCENKTECLANLHETLQLFKHDFDVDKHLNHLMEITLGTHFFSNSTEHEGESTCEFDDIINTIKRVFVAAFKAEQIKIVYSKLTNTNFHSVRELSTWNSLMYQLRQKMFDILDTCYTTENCTSLCVKGRCVKWTSINRQTCQCPLLFDGNHCEIQNQIDTIEQIHEILSISAQIPKLSGVVHTIKTYTLMTSECIPKTVEGINKMVAEKDNQMLKSRLHKDDLGLYYATFLKLQYYIFKMKGYVSCNNFTYLTETERSEVAVYARKFSELLYNIHKFIVGNEGFSMFFQEPMLVSFINRNINTQDGCSDDYKGMVDTFWKRLQLFQLRAFLVYFHVLNILQRPTENVVQLYNKSVTCQLDGMKKHTCSPEIQFSVNVHCSGGFYVSNNVTLETKCISGYFIQDPFNVSCQTSLPICKPCNCDTRGSISKECSSGHCYCNNGYYGQKCTDRHCVWGSWTTWSVCSNKCDYGGLQTRWRKFDVNPSGNGDLCQGPNTEQRACFDGCCNDQFHCSKKKNCISSLSKCDYTNNCGDNEDESLGCSEPCNTRYTDYTIDGGGNTVYLDRQNVNCGTSQFAMKKFHLLRNDGGGGYVRYHFTCCQMTKSICSYHTVHNGYTPEGGGNVLFLDRQVVSCPSNGFISQFHINRSGGDSFRYSYTCCIPESKYSTKMCYSDKTGTNEDGKGNMVYLDRHNVECRDRYFINGFHLIRPTLSTMAFEYTCCRVVP